MSPIAAESLYKTSYLSRVGCEQASTPIKKVHIIGKLLRSWHKNLGFSSELSHFDRFLEGINEG